ncbi:MAG: hypothetical protein ACYTE6_08505 [Planctomycetota bacterium]|jgi:hypothetical protein
MGLSSEQIPPERLLEAADAILEAVIEVADVHDGLYLHPPQLLGTTFQPLSLRAFTAFEVQEATQFLVRLGVLPAQTPSAPGHDGRER